MKRSATQRVARAATGLIVVAICLLSIDAHAWGFSYGRELHTFTIGRRDVPREFADPIFNGVMGGGGWVHKVALVDESGALLAGLAGGAAQHLARREALKNWAADGARDDKVSYSWSVPPSVGGMQTTLAFYWGGSDTAWGLGDGQRGEASAADSTELLGCNIHVRYISAPIDEGKNINFTLTTDIWWKNVVVRNIPNKAAGGKGSFQFGGTDEDLIGMPWNLGLDVRIGRFLRVAGYGGWDPLYGLMSAMLGDQGPTQNFQYGVTARTGFFNTFEITAEANFWYGSLGTGDRHRKMMGRNLSLTAVLYL